MTAYCALFALAILQLGVALHHDQHSATELTSTCVACIQLEQFDDLAPASVVDLDIAVGHLSVALPATQPTIAEPRRRYHTRAPPARS